jgi:hypothetical protein
LFHCINSLIHLKFSKVNEKIKNSLGMKIPALGADRFA